MIGVERRLFGWLCSGWGFDEGMRGAIALRESPKKFGTSMLAVIKSVTSGLKIAKGAPSAMRIFCTIRKSS